MDQPDYSKPLLPPPATHNPIVAVGRKVKSAFSSHQQPSIRIRRDTPRSTELTEKSQPAPTKKTFAEKCGSIFSRKEKSAGDESSDHEYDTETIDLLDVVDPEVSTLSTLTNVQNSLFVPQLGRLVNRRPTYKVSEGHDEAHTIDKVKSLLKNLSNAVKKDEDTNDSRILKNAQYAILPDGEKLEGWTNEEKEELDDNVRHMLHSRRAKFKRSLKGFGQYVRRPFGLFITVYATLITLFGAAWVFFLIGWISLGSKQDYVVNVVDNVLVALFAIIGDGLAPFRAVDTYHMCFIAYYHRKTWKKREKLGLPELVDHNDLPNQRPEQIKPEEVDLESLVARRTSRRFAQTFAPRIPKSIARKMVARSRTNDPTYEYSVLTPEQQAKLEHHERKFSKSHTFYKPHETETHYAFPLKLLVAVVLLLDLHSCLQISLGACTWGIPYETRPFALTTVILCCSITANITGGVLISIGDKKTRKKDVIERMMRQQLTSEAIESMELRWLKEAEERGEVHPSVRKRFEEEKEMKENEEIKKSWKSVPALPKTLLGKGEDHRQPSLPREARRSSDRVDKKGRSGSGLPEVKEGVASPSSSRRLSIPRKAVPGAGSGLEEAPKQGTGQKIMGYLRKADLDRS